MRIRQGTDSYELSLPGDMLESVLRDAGRIAAETTALLEPLYRLRDRLRPRLLGDGQIITVPVQAEKPTLGAVDGGSVIDQLYAADRIVVCALVAEGMYTIRTGEIHHSVWTQVLAHQTDLDRLASAVMTCLELSLLRKVGYQVRIFDGSHLTPVIALNLALSSANPRTAVKVEFRKAVWAASDDLSNEHVPAERRLDSRTAAVQCLQDLAAKWTSLADALSAVQDMEDAGRLHVAGGSSDPAR